MQLLPTQIKKRQLRIRTVLEAQKLPFDVIDVAQDDEALERMRELVGDEMAVAPQIANGEDYCGVCAAFYFNFRVGHNALSVVVCHSSV